MLVCRQVPDTHESSVQTLPPSHSASLAHSTPTPIATPLPGEEDSKKPSELSRNEAFPVRTAIMKMPAASFGA